MWIGAKRIDVAERGTFVYQANLVDQDGASVPGSSLDSLTLTLFDVDTAVILNSRSSQDVLNTNGVTVDGEGLLTWVSSAADNPLVTLTETDGTVRRYECHQAMFVATYAAGTRVWRREVTIYVKNLAKVT